MASIVNVVYRKIVTGPFPIEEWNLPGADERYWRARSWATGLAISDNAELLVGPPRAVLTSDLTHTDRCYYVWPAIQWQCIREIDISADDPLIG